jgi:hypothetical protein
MMIISDSRGTGILSAMESTEDKVAACYTQQKSLEEDDQEKLLEKEPGEVDDPSPPKADILDVTMEDAEEPGETASGETASGASASGSSLPGAATAGSSAPGAATVTYAGEGKGSSLTREVTGSKNSNTNPAEDVSLIVTGPNQNQGGIPSTNNKISRYLAAKENSPKTPLPNLIAGGGEHLKIAGHS